jgi:hypothetical protein
MWAIWQMRQAASSRPSAWECGATCRRKKKASSATEMMTDVANRRLGRGPAGCIVLPANKHYPHRWDALIGKRYHPIVIHM